jgi:heparosan-N-sulfate-glucuronate 5-epimerase
MGISQWALGCYERYLEGEGEVWLDAARQAGDYLVAEQSAAGGWYEEHAHPHTFVVRAPWLSAMAQGQCVSVLVRLFLESGEARFAVSAARGLGPMAKPFAEGGVRSYLAGSPILEEYPTDPPSHVLNGAIFALWGYYDAWRGLEDGEAGQEFRDCLDTLSESGHRWDTGSWSRYDLYPHPSINVASPFYHALHIDQLRATDTVFPTPAIAILAANFEAYAARRRNRIEAIVRKVAFRLRVR